jgi:hypothetical protein
MHYRQQVAGCVTTLHVTLPYLGPHSLTMTEPLRQQDATNPTDRSTQRAHTCACTHAAGRGVRVHVVYVCEYYIQ